LFSYFSVAGSVTVLAVSFSHRSSRDVFDFIKVVSSSFGCLRCLTYHLILQYYFGPRVGFVGLCFWCVFVCCAFCSSTKFIRLCLFYYLCVSLLLLYHPFRVNLHFCVVAGSDLCPLNLFVLLFYFIIYFFAQKKYYLLLRIFIFF
jgi:hypothetical protein